MNGRGQTRTDMGKPRYILSVVRLPFRHSPSDFLLYHALGELSYPKGVTGTLHKGLQDRKLLYVF